MNHVPVVAAPPPPFLADRRRPTPPLCSMFSSPSSPPHTRPLHHALFSLTERPTFQIAEQAAALHLDHMLWGEESSSLPSRTHGAG